MKFNRVSKSGKFTPLRLFLVLFVLKTSTRLALPILGQHSAEGFPPSPPSR